MKAIVIALLALGFTRDVAAQGTWVDVVDKVAVRIETVLYQTRGHPPFLIHPRR